MGLLSESREGQIQELIDSSEKNVSLVKRTWIHRGGIVGRWIQPQNIDDLKDTAIYLYRKGAQFLTIGYTSNMYLKNTYNVDYVLDTRKVKFLSKIDANTIECACGLPIKVLVEYCIKNGYQGFEGMIDLPGTVAGAVVNNSGCFGCIIEDRLLSIQLLTPSGDVEVIPKMDLMFSFRNSALKVGKLQGFILSVRFDISKRQLPSDLIKIAQSNHEKRKSSQDSPAFNLGTTVNTSGGYVGIRGLILRVLRRILARLPMDNLKAQSIINLIACALFGCISVNKYISKHRMSCFIWKDNNADMMFNKYMLMMNRLFSSCSQEIEIKE